MSRCGTLIVKLSRSDGAYTARSGLGTIRGLRWGKWTTVSKLDLPVNDVGQEAEYEKAKKLAEGAAQKAGLARAAVFHKGMKLMQTDDDADLKKLGFYAALRYHTHYLDKAAPTAEEKK